MGLFSSIFGTSSSTKASIPSFLKPGLTQYSSGIGNYLNSDPHQYVAPASSLQNLAFQQAQNLGGWQQPLNDALSAVKSAGSAAAPQMGPASTANVATYQAPTLGNAAQAQNVNLAPSSTINGASLLDNFKSYMDPATEALVNSTMADYNHDAASERAAQQAQLAGMGAWGSGGNFYLSNFDIGNLLKGANLENQLRSNAFTQAINASNMDAQRRQDAGAFNAGAQNTRSLQQGQMNLSNNEFNTGAQNQFKLSQAGFNADAGQFNAGQQNQVGMFNSGQQNQVGMFNTGLQNDQLNRALQAAGMQGDLANSMASNSRADTALVGTLGDMQHQIDQSYASALPTQLMNAGQMFSPLMGTVGQTQTSTPSPFNVGLSMASLFSDKRLKTDIKRVGTTSKKTGNLGIFTYRYKDDPSGTPHMGVMAQEVEKKRPEALGPTVGGYKTVMYGEL